MQMGDNIIAASGQPPFFKVSNPAAVGLPAPEIRHGDAVRAMVRSLSGFQKEALVLSARTGTMWRLVSDEGAYLNGHDAAPCPLAFLTVGMISSYMNEITALADREGVRLRNLRLIQNNFYTMQGSMRQRTMTGGALPVELEVQVETDADDAKLSGLLSNAVHASPLNGLMRGKLPSLFTLSKNGQQIHTGEAQALDAPVVDLPDGAEPEAKETDLTLIAREGMSPGKSVAKGTEKSELLAERLRKDGLKEIEQHLYSPHGSIFRFLSDEGKDARAPDAVSYISAGIAFCFMTQFGRMASMEKLNLPKYAIVQDTHFSLGGASGGTGKAGEADPVETHVHLTTDESDDIARDMLDVSEKTCFLHAFCRTDLKTRLKVTRM